MLKAARAVVECTSPQSPSGEYLGELSYEGLFAVTTNPQLILDASTGVIIQANASAAHLLGVSRKALSGMPLPIMLESRSTAELRAALETARARGVARVERLRVRGTTLDMSAQLSLVRSTGASYVLMHFASIQDEVTELRRGGSPVYDKIDNSGPALVITDTEFNLLYANQSFLRLIDVASVNEARSHGLFHWLQISAEDLSRMQVQMANRETATSVAVTLSGCKSGAAGLTAIAVAVPDRHQSLWGFSISERPRLN